MVVTVFRVGQSSSYRCCHSCNARLLQGMILTGERALEHFCLFVTECLASEVTWCICVASLIIAPRNISWGSSEALFARAFHQSSQALVMAAAAMASKNLSRCAEASFSTKFSKTLLGFEVLRSPKGAWVWQRCMRLCWTRRSPITSAQVIKRKEEKVMVEGVSFREHTKSKMLGMRDLDQSFGFGDVPKASLRRGVCYVNLCIEIVCFLCLVWCAVWPQWSGSLPPL